MKSPYFKMQNWRSTEDTQIVSSVPLVLAGTTMTGGIKTNPKIMKALVSSIGNLDPSLISITYDLAIFDASTVAGVTNRQIIVKTLNPLSSSAFQSAIEADVIAYAATLSQTLAASDIIWPIGFITQLGPTSYQTIVSQTGTAAPAANITPISTYASGTTFTWARSSAGVYTLTASTAVFSTTKTAVFISPLTNLNAQARGVVTSTTVITFTTAIGSLLGLGLLGLTATNTDALLAGTMIYVQTYA